MMDLPGLPFGASRAQQDAKKATLTPITTGTSVLGIKFEGGVLIAADMLGSYGSLARYRNVERLLKVNEKTLVAASGDIADFEFLSSIIDDRVRQEEMLADGFEFSPRALHAWLTRVLYNRRSRFNPLWNTFLVGGLQSGEPYLGYVNMIGVNFTGDCLATGLGAHFGVPQLREALERKPEGALTEAEAREALLRVLHILYYRDCRAWGRYQLGVVTAEGARVEPPQTITGNWELAHYVSGYE